jgi:hypothetical protein
LRLAVPFDLVALRAAQDRLVGSEFKAQNPTGGKFDKTVSVNPRPLRPPPECRFSRPRHRAADGAITPLEGQAIAVIAAELGEATYRKLFARADESFWDQAALKEFLASIERPEARSQRMMPAPPPQWQMSVG